MSLSKKKWLDDVWFSKRLDLFSEEQQNFIIRQFDMTGFFFSTEQIFFYSHKHGSFECVEYVV